MDKKKRNLKLTNFIGIGGNDEDDFFDTAPEQDEPEDEEEDDDLSFGSIGMGSARTPNSDPIDINPHFGLTPPPAQQSAAPLYSNYSAPAQPMSAPMNMAGNMSGNMSGGITMGENPKEQQLMVVYPKDFREAGSIADHFLDGITVIVNMENADDNNKKRTIDFLSGVIYAAHGNIKKVSNTTYVLTPDSVDFINNEASPAPNAGKQY